MMNRIRRILAAVMAMAIIMTGIPFSFAEEGQMIELTPEQIAELTAAPEEIPEAEPAQAEALPEPPPNRLLKLKSCRRKALRPLQNLLWRRKLWQNSRPRTKLNLPLSPQRNLQ